MTTFTERLKQLRAKKKATQKDVADFLHFNARSYQKIETAEVKPSFDTLIALADYFDVSTDFLLGRTDNPNSHKV